MIAAAFPTQAMFGAEFESLSFEVFEVFKRATPVAAGGASQRAIQANG